MNGCHLRRDAIIDTEGKRLVAFHLPLETLEAFASHAFVTEILGLEADELRRILILRQALLREDLPRSTENIGETLFGVLAAALLRLRHGSVPFRRIDLFLGEPLHGVLQQFFVEALQNG